MKIRTVLATAAGMGIGYVLGARAGRGKFEELKAQAQRIVTDPDVRQKVADLPTTVRETLPKAQAAVSDAIKGASDKAQSGKGRDSSSTDTTSTPGYSATGGTTTFSTSETTTPPVTPTTPSTTGTTSAPDTLGTFETPDPDAPHSNA
jgi:hypothetical protein